MNIKPTKLKDVFLIESPEYEDERGKLIKIFHAKTFTENTFSLAYRESFYSISKRNVIRGMHFQTPPSDHDKLVHVINGKALDVVLDVRNGSPQKGCFDSFFLSDENRCSVYIPKGFAHGFRAISDTVTMLYFTTKEHDQQHDSGIRWDSFGFDWGINKPIISEKDQLLPQFDPFGFYLD
jgi:dTDP-4-dehydrorhamnose 3,5-epimerase